MKIILDRFEDNLAVCEISDNGKFINIPKELFPINAIEGTIFNYENNIITLDVEETKNTSKRIKEKMDNLWE